MRKLNLLEQACVAGGEAAECGGSDFSYGGGGGDEMCPGGSDAGNMCVGPISVGSAIETPANVSGINMSGGSLSFNYNSSSVSTNCAMGLNDNGHPVAVCTSNGVEVGMCITPAYGNP